ncbi:Pet127-domain-containing protein [Fistulina hepatica ATCC 64428]|uniref:Pet127-domain-containing protein n=1 Tax=Fistulina hepatica ATCC 64428 TaxID=1128425 RepID=A0A0D7A829_9AGAR|nr:Pet127-domain-containing protein [Fistulina hepatica ATCC 64428]
MAERNSRPDLPPPTEQRPIARLAHGLERVLFNPGVHWVRDPRSRVYNFPHELEMLPKVTDFAFERIEGFVPSSRDTDLWALARREDRRFAGSTSSVTGMLSHIYFLLSDDRAVDISTLSIPFRNEPRSFTPGQRLPVSVRFNHDNGVYAIDSGDKGSFSADKNILTWMGTLLEKYFTSEPELFAAFRRGNPSSEETQDPRREAYRYSKSDKYVMRSQLDGVDPRLPGTGVFDIKTRACQAIRMDILNFEENSGFLLRSLHGLSESFEREYYDLIRSAFLKYGFQARIGNMDGIFCAYHNIERVFGFQYIPLSDMDDRIYGSTAAADRAFAKCIQMLGIISDEIVSCYPGQSVNCMFETYEDSRKLQIFVEPVVEWEGNPEEKPIAMLEVTSCSYLGEFAVRGHRAVEEVDQPWTIHWSISHVHSSPVKIRGALEAVKARQERVLSLPVGIDHASLEAWWNSLNFSGKPPAEGVSSVKPTMNMFGPPNGGVEELRALARAGRIDSQRLLEEERGKPVHVLGRGTFVPASEGASQLEEDTRGATEPMPEDTPISDASVVIESALDVDASHKEAANEESQVNSSAALPNSVENAESVDVLSMDVWMPKVV